MDIILESKNVTTQKHYSITSHWGDVTTREVGMMVRETIKRVENTLTDNQVTNTNSTQNLK